MYLPLIAIFIAISGSMGISYMAEDSSPGDALYPVKIHINDNLKQVISKEAPEENLLVSEGSSSGSVYLKSSQNIGISSDSDIQEEGGFSDLRTNVSASTSLDAREVINAR